MKVADNLTRLNLQGDLVLVILDDTEELIFTIVHVIDGDIRSLELVNKGSKARESLLLTQTVLDNLKPSKDKRAKWTLNL